LTSRNNVSIPGDAAPVWRRRLGQPGVVRFDLSKLESTVRYLGVEVEDALEISEQTEV